MMMFNGEIEDRIVDIEAAQQQTKVLQERTEELKNSLELLVASSFVDELERLYKTESPEVSFEDWLEQQQSISYEPMGTMGPDLLRIGSHSADSPVSERQQSLVYLIDVWKRMGYGGRGWDRIRLSKLINRQLSLKGYRVELTSHLDGVRRTPN